MTNSGGSRIITCKKDALAILCKAPALVHEACICAWRKQVQGCGSRTGRAFSSHLCSTDATGSGGVPAQLQCRAKRDGGFRPELDDALAFKVRSVDMVALDDALHELAKLDPQQSRIVELRFFGGLSIEETSRALNLSPSDGEKTLVYSQNLAASPDE